MYPTSDLYSGLIPKISVINIYVSIYFLKKAVVQQGPLKGGMYIYICMD